tara:strand:+ start:25183 stop:25836 length:654 start_codon:yes stop_codon:yes gene_type:complete
MSLSSEELREEIIKMGALVEKILTLSFDRKSSLDEIFQIENEVNQYHKTIDDNVFKYIALKTPIARDLRMALSVMKINAELERMADQAVSITHWSQKVKGQYPIINTMIREVLQMVKAGIDAFVEADVRKATDVIQRDQNINDLNREVIKVFLGRMQTAEITFEEGFSIIRVAKNLERIGDLTTNIAEDIIFLVSGDDIRHGKGEKIARKYLKGDEV